VWEDFSARAASIATFEVLMTTLARNQVNLAEGPMYQAFQVGHDALLGLGGFGYQYLEMTIFHVPLDPLNKQLFEHAFVEYELSRPLPSNLLLITDIFQNNVISGKSCVWDPPCS
jgi:hypothetical protein